MYDAAPGEAGQLRHLIDRIATQRAELEARRAVIEGTLRDLDEVERNAMHRLEQLEG
jgi:hypothetical protein